MTSIPSTAVAYGGDPFSEDPSVIPAHTPFWRESLFLWDWMALRTSPVYWGCGIERGRGEPVVVVPGFLASDTSMTELFQWLKRVGYKPYFSNIGRNADCPNHLSKVLLDTIRVAKADTGQAPLLIGHSLGGMIARAVALEYPDRVAGVISLGSPFKDTVHANPVIIAAADALRKGSRKGSGGPGSNIKPSCFSGHCTCTFVKHMLNPDIYQVPHFAIYTKSDGVCEWQSCTEDDPDLNDEVRSTHFGMAFNPAVFRALGRRMAQVFREQRRAAPEAASA